MLSDGRCLLRVCTCIACKGLRGEKEKETARSAELQSAFAFGLKLEKVSNKIDGKLEEKVIEESGSWQLFLDEMTFRGL